MLSAKGATAEQDAVILTDGQDKQIVGYVDVLIDVFDEPYRENSHMKQLPISKIIIEYNWYNTRYLSYSIRNLITFKKYIHAKDKYAASYYYFVLATPHDLQWKIKTKLENNNMKYLKLDENKIREYDSNMQKEKLEPEFSI